MGGADVRVGRSMSKAGDYGRHYTTSVDEVRALKRARRLEETGAVPAAGPPPTLAYVITFKKGNFDGQ